MSLNVELASGFCSLPVISDNKKDELNNSDIQTGETKDRYRTKRQADRQAKRKTDICTRLQKGRQIDRWTGNNFIL
jgi:hypothetical protein